LNLSRSSNAATGESGREVYRELHPLTDPRSHHVGGYKRGPRERE
jgi:hypothetical protein